MDAANLIKETDASLVRFQNVNDAFAAGYTYRALANGEEHLIYEGGNPVYQGLNPQDPSSLVYAINVKDHPPILLGAMYLMPDGVNGPQVGGGLTRWHSHLEVCKGDQIIIAGFNFALPGACNPSTWQDRYTTQMLHVWVVAYPGGVFSDDLSRAATTAAAQAAQAGYQARASGALTLVTEARRAAAYRPITGPPHRGRRWSRTFLAARAPQPEFRPCPSCPNKRRLATACLVVERQAGVMVGPPEHERAGVLDRAQPLSSALSRRRQNPPQAQGPELVPGRARSHPRSRGPLGRRRFVNNKWPPQNRH